jgi:hypothetical protein
VNRVLKTAQNNVVKQVGFPTLPAHSAGALGAARAHVGAARMSAHLHRPPTQCCVPRAHSLDDDDDDDVPPTGRDVSPPSAKAF